MMLTIHGLPTSTSYQDLKRLIKQECNITDFILDLLVMDDDGCKKVRIGVTDDSDGSQLMKYLNGFHWSGHVIRIVPVGKPVQSTNFDARPSFQPRNDYHNQQPVTNFGSRPVPQDNQARINNWTPNPQWTQAVSIPVTPNTFTNQPIQQPIVNTPYTHPQQARGVYIPGRPVPQQQQQLQQGYPYQPKNNIPEHTAVNHFGHQATVAQGHFPTQPNVQPAWTPQVLPLKPQPFDKPPPGAYNEMGYNNNRQMPSKQGMSDVGYKGDRHFQPHDSSPARGRISPGRRMSPGHQARRMSPTGLQGRKISPNGRQGLIMSSTGLQGRRASPSGLQGRRLSPSAHERRVSPSRMSPGRSARRMSPRMNATGRGMSPHNRRMSPHGRKISPGGYGRKMSPSATSGRRMSPGPHGHRMSPSGARRMSPGRDSPPSRRLSPTDRRMQGRTSPGRRMSPARHSPGRNSPSGGRAYSQSFHHSKGSKYDEDGRSTASNMKQVRPAYEPNVKASNQAMYSGGYRQNVHDNVYPLSSTRPDPWQQSSDKSATYPSAKTLDSRIEKFDIPRVSEHLRMAETDPKRSRSGTRDSRSPIRRDRSPIKDRYRRHSPSPRSPRRSWALEKRRSPDLREAPPPPIWPGQNNSGRDSEFPRQNRQNFPVSSEKIDKTHVPVWERPSYSDKDDVHRHGKGPEAVRGSFSHTNPIHVNKWKAISQSSPTENNRFSESVRDNYDSKEKFDHPNDRMQYTDKRDFRDYPQKKDDHEALRHKKDIPLRREDFLRNDDDDDDVRQGYRKNPSELNTEIDDVYKRVAELGKKAQEYRKNEDRYEDRDDQFYNQDEDSIHRSRDIRRDFVTETKYQGREDETKSRHSDESDRTFRHRESRWVNSEVVWRPRALLSPSVKAKRDKAAAELSRRVMNRFEHEIRDNQKMRVRDELSRSFMRLFYDMFKEEDVSYIEIVVRYNKKYDANDEAKMFEEVMSSFSNSYRKRSAQDSPDFPVKTSRRSPDNIIKDQQIPTEFQDVMPQAVDWSVGVMSTPGMPFDPMSASTVPPPMLNMHMPYYVNPAPIMFPAPAFGASYENSYQCSAFAADNGYNLYLCKYDFQPFDEFQAEELKSFLVSQMIEEDDESQGWAPDLIMKGLHTMYRYEIVAQNERSRDWLLNLDFSNFYAFDVMVYTGEELCYERAAIWLPGHSRCRLAEPLQKLKLQNKKLDGVNVGKWKFVKKVVTAKGTRIYVDIPPHSARALENHKMMLSYELQKVSVFLKTAAVDKVAFDNGLNEPSIEVAPSMQISPMPSLGQDLNVVKIGILGNKYISLAMARRIKNRMVYHLYQYLLKGGTSKTDFLKYGFCSPGYLGIVPENNESRKWLIGQNMGMLNRHRIVVVGGDESHIKYIKMHIILPNEHHNITNSFAICEKLRQSNQGVKGIHFNAWKNAKLRDTREGKVKLEVQMDLESVETIAKLGYELDYVDERKDCLSLLVSSEYSQSKLQEIIKQYRAEITDTYDIANMDIASESDDDVVCLD